MLKYKTNNGKYTRQSW